MQLVRGFLLLALSLQSMCVRRETEQMLEQSMAKQGRPGSCRTEIISPSALDVWTASYLIVSWRVCAEDAEDFDQVVIHVDGVSYSRTSQTDGSFKIFGLQDGPHVVYIAALDSQGRELEVSGRLRVSFEIRRGESLLGALAGKIRRGESVCTGWDDGATKDLGDEGYRDLTFVTAAINIGRRHGNISFEEDYIGNILHILALKIPVVIHMQEEYAHLVEPYLHSKATIRRKELSDLTAFKHFDDVETLRVSQRWQGFNKIYNPAKMELYNALVMSKIFWLEEVVEENPFGSSQFFWMDAGLCVRFVQPPLNLQALHLQSRRFLIYSMDLSYDEGLDVHGFPQDAHMKYSGKAANVLLRGNIFGGTGESIRVVSRKMDEVLNMTLKDGYMGTEESVFTLTCARHADLCNVVSVSDNHLQTEMPCRMFLDLSHRRPEARLIFPAAGSVVNPEHAFVLTDVSSFDLGQDGQVCITWDNGRSCSNKTLLLLQDLPIGRLEVQVELIGWDGLPVFASAGGELLVELAVPSSMDWGGVVLDTRQAMGDLLSERSLSGRGMVLGISCSYIKEEMAAYTPYGGHVEVLDWSDRQLLCSPCQEEAAKCIASGSLDFVYVCPPSLGEQAHLDQLLDCLDDSVSDAGLVAGGSYYTVTAPDGSLVHIIQKVVDQWGEKTNVSIQVTQELQHRSWYFSPRRKQLPR
mmetsp:Transcript_25263/g.83482  ORF Transcript_25263/g.83482 Transcript_25263/m.83482 type:complete len:695 (-) Transcript_25263:1906-3990(-)